MLTGAGRAIPPHEEWCRTRWCDSYNDFFTQFTAASFGCEIRLSQRYLLDTLHTICLCLPPEVPSRAIASQIWSSVREHA